MSSNESPDVDAEHVERTLRARAPDGGYGWVIVFGTFYSLMCRSGTVTAFGQLYPEFMATFEVDVVHVVSVNSATVFCLFFISLFAGSLCDSFGCRAISFTGTIICWLGLTASAFAPNFPILLLTYGITVGVGLGLQFMASVVIIQLYFNKKRSLALGIANSGIGVGIFVYAPLVRYLLDDYEWRSAMLALSAIWSQCFITSALIRPLPLPAATLNNNPDTKPQQLMTTTNVRDLKVRSMTLSSSSLNLDASPFLSQKFLHSKSDLSKTFVSSDSKLYLKGHSGHSGSIKNGVVGHRDSTIQIQDTTNFLTDDVVKPTTFCARFTESVRNSFDVRAFSNVYVLLFGIVQLLIVGCTINPLFIPQKCIQDGIGKTEAAFIVAMGGVGDTAGRFVLGVLGLRIDNTILFIVTVFMSGIPMVLNSLTTTFGPVLFLVVLGSFFWGGYVSMLFTTLVEYVGLLCFARVFGLLMMGSTISYGSVAPFGAYIYSVFGSYDAVFLVCGILPIVGGFFALTILLLKKLKYGTLPDIETMVT